MKYAIVTCVNGNYKVESEGFENNIPSAIVNWHQICAGLWNSADIITANVRIVDENQNVVMGKSEDISHPVTPTPAPEDPVEP